MCDEDSYNKISNSKSQSNQVNTYIKYENSTQVLDSLKKKQCSSESENSNASFLNFRLVNRSMHKNALEYLDMEEYINGMDLKNRTKCAANYQFEQPDLFRSAKVIYNSNHNIVLSQEDKVNLAEQNVRIENSKPEYILNPVAKKPEFLVIEYLKSLEKYTDTPEYFHLTQIEQQSVKHENIFNLEYIHIDKSESDEENKGHYKIKRRHKDKMKKKQVNEKSKFKTYL